MKKSLASLAATAALLTLAAVPAHAASPTTLKDARGDVVAESGGRISAQAKAATDLHSTTFVTSASGVTITWKVAKVYKTRQARGAYWQMFAAGFGTNLDSDAGTATDAQDTIAVIVENDSPTVNIMSETSADTCDAGKVTFKAKKVIAVVPYTCLGTWGAGDTVPQIAGATMSMKGTRAYTDDDNAASRGHNLVLG